MARTRETRSKIPPDDLLKPIDVLSLGGEEDVCFGKYHDLKAPECMECGDSEFCMIVKAQSLTAKRMEIEGTQRFKDIEEADDALTKKRADAKEYILDRKEAGLPRIKTIIKTSKRFNLTKDIVKELYDTI